MATLTSTGRFAAGENCANNDYFYGPYASLAAAESAISMAEMKSAGRTVGVNQQDGSVKEYWYQPNTQSQLILVEKMVSDFADLQNKPTTVSGYGITDAYTKSEVDAKVSSAYKAAGSAATVSQLGALTAANLGKVYNMTAVFTTTSDFVEGAGLKHGAGTNVAIVSPSNGVYKYDVLAGFVDLSGKADKSEMSVTNGTGADADKVTIQLKSGTSATVLKQHQDISGKLDKPSGTPTEGNFAAFDANGGVIDSNKKPSDFAPAYPGNNSDDGKILEKDSNEDAGVKWINKPTNGKSAYQIAVDNGFVGSESEWLASLKAQFGSFVPADYGTGGKPASGGTDITASASTTNYIYLVDNLSSNPTAKVMWITVVDETDPSNPSYSWENIGEVQVSLLFKSGQSLDDVNIVNDLTTGGSTDVASAETVKTLNDILFNGYHETKFVDVTDSATQADSSDTNCWMVGAAGTQYENMWRARAKTACISKYIHVSPGEIYKLQSTANTSFCVLDTLNFVENETVDFSTATGYTGMVSLQANTPLEITIPSDNTFNYIFFYTKYASSDTGFSISKKTITNIEGVFPQLEDHEGRISELENSMNDVVESVEDITGGEGDTVTYDTSSPNLVSGKYFKWPTSFSVGDYLTRLDLDETIRSEWDYMIVQLEKGDKLEVSAYGINSSGSAAKTCVVIDPNIKVKAICDYADAVSTPFTRTAEGREFAIVDFKPESTDTFYVKVTRHIESVTEKLNGLTKETKSHRIFNVPINLKKENLKIFDIGNSYTVDGTHYIGNLMQAAGIRIYAGGGETPNFSMYRATITGGSFKDWFVAYQGNNTKAGSIGYFMGKQLTEMSEHIGSLNNSDQDGDSTKFRAALHACDWDLVIIHQASQFATDYDAWNSTEEAGCLQELIRAIRSECPQATIGTYLIHSFSSNYACNFERSSKDRWKHIADTTARFVNDYGIDFVIPYGTAIQNLRESETVVDTSGNEFTGDGVHTADGAGDYVAACAYFQSVFAPRFNKTILGNTDRETPSSGTGVVNVTDSVAKACQIAAVCACNNMYELTNPDDVEGFDHYFIE